MYAYILVGYLDNETESCFKKTWKDLSGNNITKYGVEGKGKRPHITIANYDNLDKGKLVQLLNKFYKDESKITMSLNILGTFVNTGNLLLTPTLSTELLDFRRSYHNYFNAFNENQKLFYLSVIGTHIAQ